MSGYRWPIPPADRWAIIAYVQELERKRRQRGWRAAGGSEGGAHERYEEPQAALVLLGRFSAS